ncbi:MAG: ATP-binding protein [Betaproteobacteria bacterium]|nr:ATP-binding protein [Betaproteobacteria bacterium]
MQRPGRYSALFAHDDARPESFWTSLRYFNFYRILVAAGFLGATTLVHGGTPVLGSHFLELFRYTAAAYLAAGTLFFIALGRLHDRFNLQLSLHACADVVAITLLMHASGGVSSGFGVMLLIALIGAALLAPRRLAFLYAALGAIALLLDQVYWVLALDAPGADFFQAGMLSIGYFASAGVTNWLVQRVAANEALARRRGRALEMQTRVNQLVIEDMDDGVLVLDREGRVVQHNPQAKRLLGVGVLLGAVIDQVLPDFSPHWRAWRLSSAALPPRHMDVEKRGGEIRVRVVDSGTNEEFGVLFLEDMTRSREQAQQYKLAALGRLTANIAHEIRNPLSAISHAAELLSEEKRERDRQRLTRIIVDNTRRLDGMVSDVLQLSRRDRISAEDIRLRAWLGSFVEEFRANEAVGAERFAIVSESAFDPVVRFDRGHLHQVLWNLLRNAVRYASSAPGSVRIVLRGEGGQVELNVIDDGPGVPEELRSQLFEPFFTTDSKGTGLGLYLARELCGVNRAALAYVSGTGGGHFRVVCEEARGHEAD